MGFDLRSIILSWLFLWNISLSLTQYRIIGGVNVEDDEYIPYQISLQLLLKTISKYQHFCSGSIVNPTHILTAAHCLENVKADLLSVVAGIRDLNQTNGLRSNVVGFKIHPNYEPLVTGDLAILTVAPPLKLDGKKVDKIDVASTERVGVGKTLIVTGWGSVTRNISFPVRLQKLMYKSISNEECKRHMGNVTNAEICAWSRQSNRASCPGDSGGPLVMREGSKLIQVGIVSYGSLTCGYNTPNVYTRVSAFVDWIKKETT